MDSYYDYEREFSQLSAEATRSIGQLANVRGEQKKRAIRDVEKLVERLEYTFGDMENAARNSGQKGMLESSLKRKQQDLSRIRRDLNRRAQESTDDVFGGTDDLQARTTNQRDQLLSGVARIDKGTERLQTTQSIARENEDLGEDTLQTLYQQRAQLEEGVQKVESIGDNMVVARTTLGDIARRAVTDKIILGVANVALSVMIIVVILLKLGVL